jgi:nucleotide-binding universal stress UspA family protein
MLPVTRILCPTDFSGPSSEGFNVAAELGEQFRAEVLVVHVVSAMPALPHDPNRPFQVPEYERALHADAQHKLEGMADALAKRGLKTRVVIGHGDAGSEIVRIAQDEHADLIVIATHGTTGLEHILFGSVAERVVRHAHCPVLSVRAARR